MIKLTHHDDGKQKWKSHGISITDDLMFYDAEHDIFSHDPFDITGCGETKEEALEDFKQKFEYIMNEWKAFEKMLFETDVVENNIIEVDCFGKPVK